MPIDSHHEDYIEHTTQWKRTRDVLEGQDAVHKAGISYLPRLKEQSDEDYNSYKIRSTFFGAAGRTLDGLIGMVFRKPMQVEHTNIDSLINDIDLSNTSLASFGQSILSELLSVGRLGVLVEYPKVNKVVSTVAQAEAINLRPYSTIYKTEHILNWRYERINNISQLFFVTLKECFKDYTDMYAPKEIDQIRELILLEGVYTQRIYRKNEKTKVYELVDEVVPLKNNKPLDFIPFYAFGCNENNLDPEESPLLPLTDLNLAHYRVTADYEHGCHLSGLPTLMISGVTLGDNEKIHIGSASAIVAPDAQAKGEYIEVKGDFKALENNIERKEKQMAVLGARMLEQQKNGVESGVAMTMRTNGETSALASIVKLMGDQLSNMLIFMADWYGSPQDVTVTLNTDYLPAGVTAQELTALMQAYQAGGISYQVLFDNLKRGEIIGDGVTIEEEMTNIQDGQMNLANGQ
jgi:Domain of unknown function (DUF4055)